MPMLFGLDSGYFVPSVAQPPPPPGGPGPGGTPTPGVPVIYGPLRTAIPGKAPGSAAWTVKQSDNNVWIRVQLLDGDYGIPDVSGAVQIIMHAKATGGGTSFTVASEVLDAGLAVVRAELSAARLGTVASYLIEWEVTWADGTVRTWPDYDSDPLSVVPQLA